MFIMNWKAVAGVLGGIACVAGIAVVVDSLIEEGTKYDRDGYDANGFDRDGYDAEGFDRDGYDANGFDRDGYDANGYDRSGRDRRGFDRDGFDIDGFDRFGRDGEGFCRNGYGSDGFDRNGYDWQGYGRDRYNASGIDRAGHGRDYYSDHIEQLRERLDEAYHQLQRREYRYAVYDARVVMEDTLRMIVQHAVGPNNSDDRMLANLKICERKRLLDDNEFLSRLHDVRRICNANGHELDAEADMSHNKVHFVVMQIRDLLDLAERILITQQQEE